MLRYYNLWLVLGWFMVFVVCYLSLTPNPPAVEVKYFDKLQHFSAYFVLMTWFSQLYKNKYPRMFYFLFFILMGITLEILQGLGGVRFFEYNDMIANSLGVVVAWYLTKGRLKNVLLYVEKTIIK